MVVLEVVNLNAAVAAVVHLPANMIVIQAAQVVVGIALVPLIAMVNVKINVKQLE